MELVNHLLWRDADCRDEEFGTALNDDIYKLIQFALGVIITERGDVSERT